MGKQAAPPQLASLCVFGWTLASVLEHPRANNGPRTLHGVELWAGVGNVHRALKKAGYSSKTSDKEALFKPGTVQEGDFVEANITTPSGFTSRLFLVLAIVPGGLLWQAPDCSSFGFLNMKKTCRSGANPEGDWSYDKVVSGNMQNKIAAFFFALACLRDILCVTENPARSLFFQMPDWRLLASYFHMRSAIANRCAFDKSKVGERLLKEYRLMGLAWVETLGRTCPCQRRGHILLAQTWYDPRDGKMKTTGDKKRLATSAVYALGFGHWIVQKWSAASPGIAGNASGGGSSQSVSTNWKRPAHEVELAMGDWKRPRRS